MTDPVRAAQNDLAFMKEVAEDRGPLHPILGAHLFAAGFIYGLNVIWIWAGMVGLVPLPPEWLPWSWVPGTIVYVPVLIYFQFQGRRVTMGPGARTFASAWSAMALMTLTVVAVVIVARIRTGIPFEQVWPPIAFALYGGAWTVTAAGRRQLWPFLVAIGCCLMAVTCAALVGTAEHWLAMGIGLLLFLAAPGFAMMRSKKPAA